MDAADLRADERAARAVADLLLGGLALDAASLETILQTLGEADPALALARLEADPEDCDHAPLLALAYSPGPEARQTLEPALAELAAGGASGLAARVAGLTQGRATALLPGGEKITLWPRPEDIEGFVLRLRPGATAPPELREILARRFAGGLALDLAVALRHSRLAWSRTRIFFLSALLERADPAEDLRGLVAWAVDFLDLAGPQFDPRQALAWRRQALEAQLRQAGAQEEAGQRQSFEVRLSQGRRQGYVHGPDVRAALARLDRACELVLGQGGETLAGVAVRDLGQAADAGELLRLLAQEPPDLP